MISARHARTRRGDGAVDRATVLVRSEIRWRGADVVRLHELGRVAHDVGEDLVRAAVARHPDLGLCGPARQPMVWSLPPGCVSAGFAPRLVDGRMVLRLPQPRPLVITGRRLGPDRPSAPGEPSTGLGELGHTIARMAAMARAWLTPPGLRQHLGRLLELVASGWRASPDPAFSWDGGVRIHQADLAVPLTSRTWADGGHPDILELVVATSRDAAAELLNVYPVGRTGPAPAEG